jgi:aspartate aminotransferase-like enzyme
VEAVQNALQEHPEIRGVLVQISETSTGAAHPVREIAAVTRGMDVMLVADGVSAVSISPCPMDEWGIDALLTGSQKGLMLPPGLALIALSERGWKRAESIPNRDFYFNLLRERDSNLKNQSAFTPAISILSGLHESLRMLVRETGLETVYRKQWALTRMARTGIAALGFELLAREGFSWGLTSLRLPAGVGSGPLLAHALEHYGVTMAAGMEHMQDQVIRLGHMGWVDWADIAAGLHALAGSFSALGGHTGTRDYLEQALAAYENALREAYPV